MKTELEQTERTLAHAQSLLEKLSGERDRWHNQVGALRASLASLPAQSLLASAFITYLLDSAEDDRSVMVNEWRRKLKVDNFDFRKFMSSESEMLIWKSEGLPADGLSMENAIGILKSDRTALIVDPSSQASDWLVKRLHVSLSFLFIFPFILLFS